MDVMAGSAAVRMRAWSREWVRAQGQRRRALLIGKRRLVWIASVLLPLAAAGAHDARETALVRFSVSFSCRCTSLIRIEPFLQFGGLPCPHE